jgi:hypothetical protein
VAESIVCEGDGLTTMLLQRSNLAGTLALEAAVGAPASVQLDDTNITVGAVSAAVVAATCTLDISGGRIISTDAAQDAFDGAGAVRLGDPIVFQSTADEFAATLTVTHLLGPRMQAGKYTEAAGAGVRAVALPQVFPSTNYVVFVQYEDTGTGPFNPNPEVDTLAAGGFNLTTLGNGVYHWVAIHY